MLALEWADLDLVSADIARLQAQRHAAKMMGNVGRAKNLAAALSDAMTTRSCENYDYDWGRRAGW